MKRLRIRTLCSGWLALCLVVCGYPVQAADEQAPNRQPVKAVADRRLEVKTAAGTGVLALYASHPLESDDTQADIERAVLVVHGRLRNADVYWRSAQRARQAAPAQGPHTLLVVPQFLTERDLAAHRLAPDTLRWSLGGWEGGEAAMGPAPISSFEAIDAILAVLADRRRFPKLTQVVIAGHSGGGQVVQRYAVVGEAQARLAAAGIKLRYVVANPSSYLYFNAERPQDDGTFAPLAARSCPSVDRWKYGWNGAPAYARRLAPEEYERRYTVRDVVYLLGGADIDPQHPALDKSCAGEAQGPHRLARGRAYVSYLRLRHPELRQAVHVVAGVGHDGEHMLGSACGLAALFDEPSAIPACK